MDSTTAGGSATAEARGSGATHHPEIDWEAAERSPEFQELVHKRRSFVIPALAFVFVWYFGFIALAGYAPGFMGESIYEGFTVGYAIALSQFVMTWVLGWLYLRRADRDFDPLAKRAAERASSDARPETEEPLPPGKPRVRTRRFAPRTGEEVTRR
jgi:uncharacterized membrane protein (DUF485 family)